MKEKVRLKSYTKGIKIVIDEEANLDEILSEIAEKFKDSENSSEKQSLQLLLRVEKIQSRKKMRYLIR